MKTREVGTVKWFNASKGFGWIKRDSDNKDFFVHFKSIRGEGYRSLFEGDNVTFSIKKNEKDLECADDVVVFDSTENKEIRTAVVLGLFKPAGAKSQLQQSFSKTSIFEEKLISMVFDFAGFSSLKK